MTLVQLIALVRAGHWLPVFMLGTLIARKLVSPDSRFPLSIPTTWQPSVTALGGLVYGFEVSLQSGATWATAFVTAATTAGATGFLDGVLTAIFNQDNAPVWARALVGIFDDLSGATPVTGAAKERVLRKLHPTMMPPPRVTIGSKPPPSMTTTTVTATATATASSPPRSITPTGFAAAPPAILTTPPKGPTGGGLAVVLVAAMLSLGHTACKPAIVVPPNVPVDVQNAIACVESALLSGASLDVCIAQYGPALVADAIQILIHSTFGSTHPELLPKMQTTLASIRR